MPTLVPPSDGLRILQQAGHAFGSTMDPEPAVETTIHWILEALGSPASVRVSLPDRSGRLREVSSGGDRFEGGRRRSARRRLAFNTMTPQRIVLGETTGRALLILPLVAQGRSVGVVEIVAAVDAVDGNVDLINAVATQAAAAFLSAQERSESRRAIDGMAATVELAAALIRARNPLDALGLATRLCHLHLNRPVIGCLPDSGLVTMHGLPSARRAHVRRALEGIAATPGGSRQVVVRLRPVLGQEGLVAVEAGQAVILVVTSTGSPRIYLETIGRLLADALDHIGEVHRAQARTENLDMGIAWTAHELREPLIGAKAALDHVAAGSGATRSELLDRTRDELGQLLELVDPLLRFSSGSASLQRRRVDLVALAREVAQSGGGGHDRVKVVAPERIVVRADPVQLRTAVSNLVRNAIAYSGAASPVQVTVAESDGWVTVCVEDQGPGVPDQERELIFDPFARGGSTARMRTGRGLGLFIARRVVEAHGGSLRLLAGDRGAVFCVELPLLEEGSQRSAS